MRCSCRPRCNNMSYDDFTNDFGFDNELDNNFGYNNTRFYPRPCPRPCPPPCCPPPYSCICPYPIPIPSPGPVITPSSISAQNIAGDALAATAVRQPIVFNAVTSQTGSGIAFVPGSSAFSLRSPGTYYVSYSITYTLSPVPAPQIATINTFLTLNGAALTGGNQTTTVTNGNSVTQSASTLVNVTSASSLNPAILELNAITNQELNYSNATITIYRVR